MDGGMMFISNKYLVRAYNEPTYTLKSSDNTRVYELEYALCHPSTTTSKHGYVGGLIDGPQNSCILLAGAGPTIVHGHSAVIVGDMFFAAIGDLVVALDLPSLHYNWHQQADTATCFGIYYSQEYDCLIAHGECEITRISLEGQVEWTVSGADIFTEGFSLYKASCEVVDFNRTRYWIDLYTGKIKFVDG